MIKNRFVSYLTQDVIYFAGILYLQLSKVK